ncbi:MAG: TerC/Alx family metal homeostasis membrane protein [Phycisphaerae bacterium]
MDLQYFMAWSGFTALVLALLAFDLLVLHRKPHHIQFREALIGTIVPIVVATLFGLLLYQAYEQHWFHLGIIPPGVPAAEFDYYPDTGAEAVLLYFTGYLVELSLSADNVFLFVVLLGYFAVPIHLQHRVLFWGILGALVMRGIMIVVGTELLLHFGWIMYLFGLFLLLTGLKMLVSKPDSAGKGDNIAVRLVRRFLPVTPDYHGPRFLVRLPAPPAPGQCRTFLTKLMLVLIAIEFTDLVFALDSIPAIFGITKDPFLVFTSNVFAILGLRSMYFLLAGVIDKFHLLRFGLALILAFVGVKMLLPGAQQLYELACGTGGGGIPWHINKYVSLGVIILTLAGAVIGSLVFPKRSGPEARVM